MGSHELPNGVKLAKYLNSPQTVVFDKGANLFALNLAKNSNEKRIILYENNSCSRKRRTVYKRTY